MSRYLIRLKRLNPIVSIILNPLWFIHIRIFHANLLGLITFKAIPDIMFLHDDMMTIPVLYCKNDGHYHSILPNSIIVPHISFSLFFILKVLSAKFFTSLTVKNICDMFQISTSTLYRWIKRYNAYLRIFTFLKNRYHSHFFIHLLYDFSHIIYDLFDLNLHTLFQYDRKLFNQRK